VSAVSKCIFKLGLTASTQKALKKPMPSTSVALCTYNGERFLQIQLDSLAAQTILPGELIICDDASTDGTLLILENFSKIAPFPVRIFSNKRNLGYVKNFELAISLCTNEIIFLCDQDDYWEIKKIESVLNTFETEPDIGMVLHGFSKIDFSGNPYVFEEEWDQDGKLPQEFLQDELIRNSIRVFVSPSSRAWCGCMTAFRNIFTKVIIPIYPGKGHDDWILKIIAPFSEVRFNSECLIRYRIHDSNINSHELVPKTFFVLLKRFFSKLHRVRKGYSKSNFYRSIIERVNQSDLELRHPELLKFYKNYIKFF
jgi:glycosyltransferase involved in cell wall biosynthesis